MTTQKRLDHSTKTRRGSRKRASAALTAGFAVAALALSGCQDDYYVSQPAPPPPCLSAHAPVGLYSVTGDRAVYLYWIPVEPQTVDYFVVYRSGSPSGPYHEIGHASGDGYTDQAVVNGVTYFYAVSAVDRCGAETPLSREVAFDTPRPEGFGARIHDADGENWTRSAWQFSMARTVPWDYAGADVYYIVVDGVGYLVATDLDTDIQDAGFGDFDSVDWAPVEGWSPTGTAEVIPGHVYVVWTRDNHFAKLRAVSESADYLIFDWGYQVDPGNQELLVRPPRKKAPWIPTSSPR